MSLFSTLGQGDIWSAGGISFASPINDILDKVSCTIEELLEEDEILQEMKSGNDRLLEFVHEEENMAKLIGYIVTPPAEGDNDLRVFRYPYMSCELFCCENPRILRRLVEFDGGRFLIQLFSLLSLEPPLDHYLAGYFEKVLEMLFRRMTVPVMAFLNSGGVGMLQQFVKHIDNYSIMQIVQRVLLPHIPFSMDDVDRPPEEREMYQCNWSFQKESCDLLCEKMLDRNSSVVPSHISDMLITVLQLSPHESSILSNLCVSEYLQKMLESSFNDGTEMDSVADEPSVEASISLAAISVLESLISRLCETMSCIDFGALGGEGDDKGMTADDIRRLSGQVAVSVDRISRAIIPFVPKIATQLRAHIDTPVCGMFDSQTRCSHKRLGPRGLHLVKLIESTVRLANDEIDDALCAAGVFSACLEMMFSFELHSLLHLSVQRIVLNLIEVGATYRTLRHLLGDCGLIEKIVATIREEVVEDEGDGADISHLRVSGSRRPVVGHVITIAQSLFAAVHDGEDGSADDSLERSGSLNTSQESVDRVQSTSAVLRRVLEDADLMQKWEAFEKEEFRMLMDRQIFISSCDAATDLVPTSALEALKLNESWPAGEKQDDAVPSSRAFDDFDDDDEDETYHHLDYNLPTYGATNASSSAYVHHDSYSSSDDDDVDDEREIGDQFADFGSSAFSDTFKGNTNDFADFPDISAEGQRPFEASFDIVGASATATPSFEAAFDANFDAPNPVASGDDFFAAFPAPPSVFASEGAAESGDVFDPFGAGPPAVDAFADVSGEPKSGEE